MKNIFNFFIILTLFITISACEDVVQLKVKEGINQLSVDAMIDNSNQVQKVKLSISQGYFDNTDFKPALGAIVKIFNEDSVSFEFKDSDNSGVYTFSPKNNEFNKIGSRYALYVKYKDEEYYSIAKLNRVPKIDSITYEVESLPFAPQNGPKEGFAPQFYAKDFEGEGDCYWIKSAINNKYTQNAQQLNLAYDAGFSPGSKTDGLMFILPIRTGISNQLIADKDTLKVDIYSIGVEQFYYLQGIQQISRNGGLFATPLSNLPSNIINMNQKSEKKALGFFGLSAVSSAQTIIDKNKAKPKK